MTAMRNMRVLAAIGTAMLVTGVLYCLAAEQGGARKKLLVYSESDGFRHSVVARPLTGELSFAEKILKDILTKAGYEVYFSQCFHDLKDEKQFDQFDGIILYTSGNPKINREALLKWLRSGRTLVGIHAATDSFTDDEAFVRMIGAAFLTHGAGDKEVTVKVENRDHPSTRMLPAEWVLADEIYQFKGFSRDNVRMLISIDTGKTNLEPQRMKADEYYPVAWTREEGKGRVFYTSLGHREDVWTNPLYQDHVLAGVAWALGLAEAK